MALTKTPFLSLGSQGSIGEVLTTQKRDRSTLVRVKPTPSNPRSLPQMYQRWLYNDYVYLWHQQTALVKRAYAVAGVRHHLTGFQYWMKYHLANMPDILAWYHLDSHTGSIAYDTSRNTNNGTIIGATPVTGLIDGALSFDRLNDQVAIPAHTSFDVSDFMTIELRLNLTGIPPTFRGTLFGRRLAGTYFMLTAELVGNYYWHVRDLVNNGSFGTTTLLNPGSYVTIHAQMDGTKSRIFFDGVEDPNSGVYPGVPSLAGIPLYLGCERGVSNWLGGILDEVIFYHRVLDTPEMIRHSLRRYPL